MSISFFSLLQLLKYWPQFHTATVLKCRNYMRAHENIIPLRGEQKEITGVFVSASVDSEQRGIKRSVFVFVEG